MAEIIAAASLVLSEEPVINNECIGPARFIFTEYEPSVETDRAGLTRMGLGLRLE